MNDSYRVAVIGSDEDNLSDIEKERLYPLCISFGKKLADNNCVVFTGGDRGIGLKVLQGVCENGGMTVVFFPGQENTLPMDVVKIPIYTGVGYGIRDILMLRTVDDVVSLAGGAGTLNELANAYHLYKPIITLKNSGGWTERIEDTYIDSKKDENYFM